MYASGNITAYSDERLKSNVETIGNALDKVMAIRGVTFNRVQQGTVGTFDSRRYMGVIAQEIQKVIPEVIFQRNPPDGLLSVDYGNIVGLLIEAIKELKDQVDALKN